MSRAAGAEGLSTLGLAQILGQSERNNRQDHVAACLMTYGPHLIQVIEGRPFDVDRLMTRIRVDSRHRNLTVLMDKPIAAPVLDEPMGLCGDASELIARLRRDGQDVSAASELEDWLAVGDAA